MMIVVDVVVAVELVIQESVLKCVKSKEISHMRDDDEEVEEEKKRDLRRKMREFITHFTER